MFVGFTGEELGLFGSRAYVFDPPRPLDRTVAMVNLDMVGRLRDHALYARAYPAALAERAAGPVEAVGARLGVDRGPDGTSDHLVFAAAGVPALQLFTGMHGNHHETTDLASALNVEGLAAVSAAAALALDLATTGSPPARAQDPCEEWAWATRLRARVHLVHRGGRPLAGAVRGARLARRGMGLRPGDVVLRAWDDLARGWPTEPVALPVRRGEACLRLSLAKAPEPVRCETVD